MALAIFSYAKLPALADENGLLNLAWTLDERSCLSVDLAGLIAQELDNGRTAVSSYLVQDPYGEQISRPAITHFFPELRREAGITCAAGVNSLLHALAQIAAGKTSYIIGEVYPDFPHWVEKFKGKCESLKNARIHEHVSNIRACGACIVLMDRPALIGTDLSLSQLRELCHGIAPSQTIVLVDESNANYCPPAFSAVNIMSEVENLAVLRGLSKAYSMGGLRLGYCISSPQVTGRIRDVISPMLVASLSLKIGHAILQLGDIAAHLRQRVPVVKQEMESLLDAAQISGRVPSSAFTPYIFLDNRVSGAARRLESHGIIGKSQPFWRGLNLCRLSVPLTPERMRLLKQKLGLRG